MKRFLSYLIILTLALPPARTAHAFAPAVAAPILITAGGPVVWGVAALAALVAAGTAVLAVKWKDASNNDVLEVQLNPKQPQTVPSGWTAGAQPYLAPVPPNTTGSVLNYGIAFCGVSGYSSPQLAATACNAAVGNPYLQPIYGTQAANGGCVVGGDCFTNGAVDNGVAPIYSYSVCPPGYSLQSNVCTLTNAPAVPYPSDGKAKRKVESGTQTADPRDPDTGLPPGVTSTPTVITVKSGTSTTTTTTITTAASEQYLANFNQAALARAPYTNESSYWNDILRAAYPNGQSSMLLAVRELGKTLFESADYAARARSNHLYVYDLYKTYLMREPDPQGWAFWESVCDSNGRENVRRAFDECSEFAGIVATLTPIGSASSTVSSLASARVDPFNQPGSGLTARDAEWSVPLLSLPGRAGLDLGLNLSYSSMVWTRSGPYIYFDEDNGWPSPGFHLGFPTLQEKVFDAQAGRNVYLLISGGSRVSLRQMGTSNIYEAADSSYLQLIDYGSSLLVR